MNKIKVLLFVVLLCSGFVKAAIYKWTDAEGKVHYSDKKITKNDAVEIKAPPKPNEADVNAATEKLNKLKQDLEISNKLKAQELEKQKEADAKAAQKKKKCLAALDNLEHMKYARGVYVKDKAGNKVFYDEKIREQRTNQYQKAYNANCL